MMSSSSGLQANAFMAKARLTGRTGDVNGDGVVSAGDYASVQANFGNVAPAMTVPEPATMSLLAIGCVGILIRRRGFQRQ